MAHQRSSTPTEASQQHLERGNSSAIALTILGSCGCGTQNLVLATPRDLQGANSLLECLIRSNLSWKTRSTGSGPCCQPESCHSNANGNGWMPSRTPLPCIKLHCMQQSCIWQYWKSHSRCAFMSTNTCNPSHTSLWL